MFGSEVYKDGRFWEIDLLRGTGISMMLISNFVTDLQFFLSYSGHPLFWYIFAHITAGIFVFTSGLSMWVSLSRSRGYKKYLIRFGKLFGIGMLITLVTELFLSEGAIYFGVLHFLGLATLLVIPFRRLGRWNFLAALPFLALAPLVSHIHGPLYLLPLGITPGGFFTLDYFPIFPWFGVYLLGFSMGAFLYPRGKRAVELPLPAFLPVELLCFLGRHTLKLYLIHQPVFVGLLLLFYGPLPGLI